MKFIQLIKVQLIGFLIILWLSGAHWSDIAFAQTGDQKISSIDASVSTVHPNAIIRKPVQVNTQYLELSQSLEKTLRVENDSLKLLRKQIIDLQQSEKSFDEQINSHKIRISSYSNMVGLLTTRVDDLESALITCQTILGSIDSQRKTLSEKNKSIENQFAKTSDQYAMNQKQLNEIKVESAIDYVSVTEVLVENLETLTWILKDKLSIMEKMKSIYAKQSTLLNEIQLLYSNWIQKCNTQIEKSKRFELFQRKSSLYKVFDENVIQSEIQLLFENVSILLHLYYWKGFFNDTWQFYGFGIIAFLITLIFFQILLYKLSSVFKNLSGSSDSNSTTWKQVCFKLIAHSLPLFGLMVFLFVYSIEFTAITPIKILQHAVAIWLFTRWGLVFLTIWKQTLLKYIPVWGIHNFRLFIILIRVSALSYIILKSLLGSQSVILSVIRISLHLAAIIWAFLFWKWYKSDDISHMNLTSKLQIILKHSMIILSNCIIFGALILELSGYGQLATYWLNVWGKTIIIFVWAIISFMALKEWDQEPITSSGSTAEDDTTKDRSTRTIKWTLVRMSMIIWIFLIVICFLLTWGMSMSGIVNLFRILNYPIPIGGLQLCVFGFFYAIIILLLTQILTRFVRTILIKRLLINSGMAIGIQESIATIITYSFWLFGILLALNAIGISTTSLAVAFGALGIGLGFGLQNIFNNFISGLILLFERPVQVGDWLEINGIWGQVIKINVRSTIVQSVDNASLIIPNSEFISKQVINWSFKDYRVRRTIVIGVAYGSDIEMVMQILLDIAQKNKRVLKNPAPDVVFDNFGDSALIVKLRIWVHVDYSISTQTAVRKEIYRCFKEKNIIIPFPQRDVHLYSKQSIQSDPIKTD